MVVETTLPVAVLARENGLEEPATDLGEVLEAGEHRHIWFSAAADNFRSSGE